MRRHGRSRDRETEREREGQQRCLSDKSFAVRLSHRLLSSCWDWLSEIRCTIYIVCMRELPFFLLLYILLRHVSLEDRLHVRGAHANLLPAAPKWRPQRLRLRLLLPLRLLRWRLLINWGDLSLAISCGISRCDMLCHVSCCVATNEVIIHAMASQGYQPHAAACLGCLPQMAWPHSCSG